MVIVMSIQLNSQSIKTSNQVNNVRKNQAKTMAKIASGKKIVSASDNAANLAIANLMKAQNRGYSASIANVQNGISMLQVAEGGMSNITEDIQRMRELAVQASNGTYTDEDRAMLQLEFDQLTDHIDEISNNTEFNTKKLLNGSLSKEPNLTIQGGPNSGEEDSVAIGDMTSKAIGLRQNDGKALSISDAESAANTIQALDDALKAVNSERSNIGAKQNSYEHMISNMMVARENIEAAESRISDADIGKELIQSSLQNIQEKAAEAMLVHQINDRSYILNLINS
jgi:flagellin